MNENWHVALKQMLEFSVRYLSRSNKGKQGIL